MFFTFFVSPSATKPKTPEELTAQRTLIEARTLQNVASDPALLHGFPVQPVPPTAPPLARKEIEERREKLTGALVSAASAGNREEFDRIASELAPNASTSEKNDLYSSVRARVFSERRSLVTEAFSQARAHGDANASQYWVKQLVANAENRFEAGAAYQSGPLKGLAMTREDVIAEDLAAACRGLQNDEEREELLHLAIRNGAPASSAMAAADSAGMGTATLYNPNGNLSVKATLAAEAVERANRLFQEMRDLHSGGLDSSPTARMEFNRRETEFERLTGRRVPESVFAGGQSGQDDFMSDTADAIRKSAGIP